MKKFIALFCVTLSVLSCVSCGSTPETTVDKYFSAVKSGDMETAMECFVPAIQDSWELGKSAGNALGSIFGIGSGAGGMVSSIMGLINNDYYKNFKFEIKGTEYKEDDSAIVTVDVENGGEHFITTTVELEKINGEWLISK